MSRAHLRQRRAAAKAAPKPPSPPKKFVSGIKGNHPVQQKRAANRATAAGYTVGNNQWTPPAPPKPAPKPAARTASAPAPAPRPTPAPMPTYAGYRAGGASSRFAETRESASAMPGSSMEDSRARAEEARLRRRYGNSYGTGFDYGSANL